MRRDLTMAVRKPKEPRSYTLPVNTRLTCGSALRRGQYVLLGRPPCPYRIADLRSTGAGRLVELDGHRPIYVRMGYGLQVCITDPPPTR
jgi:hypothetical protein